jgi:TatD DNase family protein
MLVDSHCHLDFKELHSRLDELLENAKNSGVEILQTICTKISEFDKILKIANDHDNIFCSVGVHPNNVAEEGVVKAEKIIELANHKKVIGIGETGLDYYYENSPKAEQIESFKEHIKAAQTLQLPVIIHMRDAEEDTLKILKETLAEKNYPALIHCFTASEEFAKEVLILGLYISISGIVTFKNAKSLQDAVKNIPLEKILVETDSPYLAPVPNRGKTNEPSNTKHTAEFLAKHLNIPFETLAKATTDNFFKLFSKAYV